jgi:hypothetical protein
MLHSVSVEKRIKVTPNLTPFVCIQMILNEINKNEKPSKSMI